MAIKQSNKVDYRYTKHLSGSILGLFLHCVLHNLELFNKGRSLAHQTNVNLLRIGGLADFG